MDSKILDFSKIKALAIDLDGVIFVGDMPVPGAVKMIQKIERLGLKFFFITNNSSKSRYELLHKLDKYNIKASIFQIFNSGHAAALYLQQFKNKSKICVIGTRQLEKEILTLGFKLVQKPPCDFLVVGFDPEFSYSKICMGVDLLLSGAKFLVCNMDANFPIARGKILPGCGAMVAAISAASGRKPDFVAGKPNTFILEQISKAHKLKAKEILVIGDTPESDIVMANRFGSPSVLVCEKDIRIKSAILRPVLRMKKIYELLEFI